jgi:hypothetical protein
LETDNVSVLDFARHESLPKLHLLDHASFDFLVVRDTSIKKARAHVWSATDFVKLQRRCRCPAHPFANEGTQLSHLLVLADKDLALSQESLPLDVEPLQKDHDGRTASIADSLSRIKMV